jgi:hypothetical protein
MKSGYISLTAKVARLAQSVEHETLNLRVVGSSPTLGGQILPIYSKCTNSTHFQNTFLENHSHI